MFLYMQIRIFEAKFLLKKSQEINLKFLFYSFPKFHKNLWINKIDKTKIHYKGIEFLPKTRIFKSSL